MEIKAEVKGGSCSGPAHVNLVFDGGTELSTVSKKSPGGQTPLYTAKYRVPVEIGIFFPRFFEVFRGFSRFFEVFPRFFEVFPRFYERQKPRKTSKKSGPISTGTLYLAVYKLHVQRRHLRDRGR